MAVGVEEGVPTVSAPPPTFSVLQPLLFLLRSPLFHGKLFLSFFSDPNFFIGVK